MKQRLLYVGLDVQKKTTDVTIASGRSNGKVRSYGKIATTLDSLNKLIKELQDGDIELRFVCEAGPCGYQIYRHFDAKGIHCSVVARSMIPRRSGDRINTDRRDAINCCFNAKGYIQNVAQENYAYNLLGIISFKP